MPDHSFYLGLITFGHSHRMASVDRDHAHWAQISIRLAASIQRFRQSHLQFTDPTRRGRPAQSANTTLQSPLTRKPAHHPFSKRRRKKNKRHLKEREAKRDAGVGKPREKAVFVCKRGYFRQLTCWQQSFGIKSISAAAFPEFLTLMAPECQTSDLARSPSPHHRASVGRRERERENLHLQTSLHQVLPKRSNIPAHHQQSAATRCRMQRALKHLIRPKSKHCRNICV